jgi:hypothetical protein
MSASGAPRAQGGAMPRLRNKDADPLLSLMAKYFFDFRARTAFSCDDEGLELSDIDAAHGEAVAALSDGIQDIIVQGASDQHFAVEVRDDLGPVLEVAAVLRSRIIRRQ